MSTITVSIPKDFHYVGASILSTVLVVVGHYVSVGRYRKRAGIPYPQMYAEKAEAESNPQAHIFNCAQRAHQNTLESLPIVIIPAIISGLRFPIPTAAAVTFWSFGRIFYTRGYTTGNPKKRAHFIYTISQFGAIGLLGSAIYTTVNWFL